MPIMPYTSNPQINSTGRSLKEHVFRSQFIAFVVFSIPETEKRKTQNKSWKQKMDCWKRLRFQFSFYRFPFNGKCLRFFVFPYARNLRKWKRETKTDIGNRFRFLIMLLISETQYRDTDYLRILNSTSTIGRQKCLPVEFPRRIVL